LCIDGEDFSVMEDSLKTQLDSKYDADLKDVLTRLEVLTCNVNTKRLKPSTISIMQSKLDELLQLCNDKESFEIGADATETHPPLPPEPSNKKYKNNYGYRQVNGGERQTRMLLVSPNQP